MPKKSPTPDFGYTPEQIKEMQNFFKNNDFTANFSLQHEITLTGAKAEVFNKAKYAFTKYWLDNLPVLGIKRQMKNFAKEYFAGYRRHIFLGAGCGNLQRSENV